MVIKYILKNSKPAHQIYNINTYTPYKRCIKFSSFFTEHKLIDIYRKEAKKKSKIINANK